MIKPPDLFGRDREWASLTRFVAAPRAGTSLGLVYGRRRQGKTYLLESLVEAHDGLYVNALQQSGRQNLDRVAQAYARFTGSRARVAFDSWEEALTALLALGEGAERPVVVVLDEFPYLLDAAPEIPSLLQHLLRPRGPAATSWRTRLVLCGSALSTMRSLLAGTAPLRGRAALEMVVEPFGFREAARFWQADDLDLAVRLHALVGGTPGYLDMSGGAGPRGPQDLDDWVVGALLDPSSAMLREGDVILAEQDGIADPASYFAVLAALARGRTRRGEIAADLGRPVGALAHPLAVLTSAGLIAPVDDALRQRRTTYRIAEPVLRLHQLVITPQQQRLVRHHGAQVWADAAASVSSNVYGPHFEDLCRAWCLEHADAATLGGAATSAAPTVVACREHGGHEVDVVVTATGSGGARTTVAIGEAKWRSAPVAQDQLVRLDHVRDLMGLPAGTYLLLLSRRGFTAGLHDVAEQRGDVQLVDLDRLYAGA